MLWDGTYGHYKGSTFFSVILNKDPEFWSGQGSNPRPPALQTSALPTEPTRRRLLKKRGISFNPADLVSSYCISESNALTQLVTLGAFHLVKISGISGSAVNRTHFVGSSHWKIPRKSGKSKKVGPFSRLEFPNGMSCSIYVSRSLSSLYQFQVHGQAPRRTGVYDQMEQLFTNWNFHFCSHRNFWVFFLNGKRPKLAATWSGVTHAKETVTQPGHCVKLERQPI